MKKLLTFFSLLFLYPAFAQDARELITRMNQVYAAAKSTSMNFTAAYYSLASQPSATSTVHGEVRYSGTNYFSDAMGEMIVVNKHYTLIIDKSQHTITCLPAKEKNKDKSTPGASGTPDTAWATGTHLKLLDQSGSSRRIEITGDNELYEKTEIKINASTYALEQVTYYYSKLEDGSKPKLVITYAAVRFNSGITEADFSEKNYIRKTNGKLVPAPAWNNYQVIDLTSGTQPQ